MLKTQSKYPVLSIAPCTHPMGQDKFFTQASYLTTFKLVVFVFTHPLTRACLACICICFQLVSTPPPNVEKVIICNIFMYYVFTAVRKDDWASVIDYDW